MNFSTLARIFSIITLTLLASLLFGNSSQAQTAAFTVNAGTERRIINRIEFLAESGPLDYQQASAGIYASQWRPMAGNSFNFGNFHAPVWIRFDVVNPYPDRNTWVMEIGQPLLDRVSVTVYDHNTSRWSTTMEAGNLVPVYRRPIRHRCFLFPLTLPPNARLTVYARVASVRGLYFGVDLWQEQAFWPHDLNRTLLLGLFIGILAVMFLYNLSIYIFTRDGNYLAYSAYVMAVILYELAATGIGGRYLWDHAAWLRQNAYLTFASLSFLTGTIFIRKFLSLKQYGGWLLQLNNVFLIAWIIGTPLCPLVVNPIYYHTMELIALFSPVAGMVTCVYLWAKGNVQAKYYTIAYVCLDVGTVILMLGMTGVMTRGLLTEYAQVVGFMLELVLLSLALADRISRDRTAREEAQLIALDLSRKVSKNREEKLMVQEQLIEVQRRVNEDLETRVLERTNELERAMNNLELANKELSKLSFTDPLTKLYNRRYLDEILLSEVKRASRTQQYLSVALVDIDRFKRINDTHGHLIGDECLRLAAKTINRQLGRSGDLIARFGGEAFVVIMPATPPRSAMIVADRIRKAVAGINFIHRGTRIQMQVSIGIAGWIPGRDENNERLINATYNALHQAKRTGRNRSVAAEM